VHAGVCADAAPAVAATAAIVRANDFIEGSLCKAVLDRITDRAHIIDNGHESYRFCCTIEERQKNG
jgi:hypothetical protein